MGNIMGYNRTKRRMEMITDYSMSQRLQIAETPLFFFEDMCPEVAQRVAGSAAKKFARGCKDGLPRTERQIELAVVRDDMRKVAERCAVISAKRVAGITVWQADTIEPSGT